MQEEADVDQSVFRVRLVRDADMHLRERMAIDFRKREGTSLSLPLFQLSHADYGCLETALEEFERRTGVFIDPYGTTLLSAGHLSVLAGLMSGDHPPFGAFSMTAVQGTFTSWWKVTDDPGL